MEKLLILRKKNQKHLSRNQGIEILRTILIFWIVIRHTYMPYRRIWYIIIWHVPTLLVISFYFFYKTLSSRNIAKLKQRFERLLIPYIIWPIIIFLFNNILIGFSHDGRDKKKYTITQFKLQILIGSGFYPIFWFQFDMIFFSLFYCIISFLFKNNFLVIFELLSMFCYYFQYDGIIYDYFNKEFRIIDISEMSSIIEIIPLSITGLVLYSWNFISIIKDKKKEFILLSIILIYLTTKFEIFNRPKGGRYSGIELNIPAIGLFGIFYIIPLGKIKNKKIITFISVITNYTGGIYYIHMKINYYLRNKILFINNHNLSSSILIYIISYFLCFIGMKIFGKTKLKNLFY